MNRVWTVVTGIGMALVLSGCSATQETASVDMLRTRIAALEHEIASQDRQIEDLQAQVSRLSSEADKGRTYSLKVSDTSQTQAMANKNTNVIRVGASTQDVQAALKAAGFYKGPVDGKVGRQTIQAIQKFQRSRGLTSDGIVGKRTWEQLTEAAQPSEEMTAE